MKPGPKAVVLHFCLSKEALFDFIIFAPFVVPVFYGSVVVPSSHSTLYLDYFSRCWHLTRDLFVACLKVTSPLKHVDEVPLIG